MNAYADDGFGNMVSVANPFGMTTNVYVRIDGKLAHYEADTPNPLAAIKAVRTSLYGEERVIVRGRNAPVLAVVAKAKKLPAA